MLTVTTVTAILAALAAFAAATAALCTWQAVAERSMGFAAAAVAVAGVAVFLAVAAFKVSGW
jgi:hypothetical protein